MWWVRPPACDCLIVATVAELRIDPLYSQGWPWCWHWPEAAGSGADYCDTATTHHGEQSEVSSLAADYKLICQHLPASNCPLGVLGY